jgi:FkbM family methyltransferase
MSDPQSYSQWGEDKLVWEYFQRRTKGFFIEVGANEPEGNSQTLFLEQRGWEGILVEPQAECCERLRQARPRSQVFQVACGAPAQRGKALFRFAAQSDRSTLASQAPAEEVTFTHSAEVEVVTLDDLLARAGNPQPDFLSIDVEGAELDVLKGFDLARHRPGLILVEDYVYDLGLHSHLRSRNYKLVKRTGSNNWYVPTGASFPVSLGERLKLFRKMHLATPLRKLKRRLR